MPSAEATHSLHLRRYGGKWICLQFSGAIGLRVVCHAEPPASASTVRLPPCPRAVIPKAVDASSVIALGIILLATVYAFARKALLSLTYAIAILAVYVLQVASAPLGIAIFSPIVFELGLVSLPGSAPSAWSWLTFEFVHASETHVFLNLLGLVFLSPTFEERIGSPRWALLYFVGGAFGAFAFLAVNLGH